MPPPRRLIATDYQNGKPGGYVSGPPAKRSRQMDWTIENENKLLLFTFEQKMLSRKDFKKIAEVFPDKPSAKAIEVRSQKLRVMAKTEQGKVVEHEEGK